MDDHALHVDDDGFVRAPVAVVYPTLTNLAAWPDWWPSTRVRQRGRKDHVRLVVGRGPWRLVLDARAHAWRHDAGFRLTVTGAVEGEVEFWLEEGWGGTVVHHLATLRAPHRRAARRYRRWARGGLWGVKDAVEAQVLAAEPA